MGKDRFYSNREKFSKILIKHDTNLSTFLFDSQVYVEGIRESVSEVKKCCKPGSKILDLGCGTGFLAMQLASLGFRVRGIDVEHKNSEKIEEFKKKKGLQLKIWRALENDNLKLSFYDGLKLPFANRSMESVVAHAVIEHIPKANLPILVEEIRRVLKPGGLFFIFRTPRRQAYAEHLSKFLKLGSHEILMDEQKVAFLLETHGFKIISHQRTDMIIGCLPGKLQDIWNLLSPFLLKLDKLLLKTPLNYFAHYMRIVCLKVEKD